MDINLTTVGTVNYTFSITYFPLLTENVLIKSSLFQRFPFNLQNFFSPRLYDSYIKLGYKISLLIHSIQIMGSIEVEDTDAPILIAGHSLFISRFALCSFFIHGSLSLYRSFWQFSGSLIAQSL